MYSPIINLVIAASLFIHTISTQQSTFRNLSSTVFKHDIAPYLSMYDLFRRGVPISTLTYRAFASELHDIHQIKSIITNFIQSNGTIPADLKQLAMLHDKRQFSELFSYRRMIIINKLGKHFQPLRALRAGTPINPDLVDIYHALNVTCITMDEYKQLSFADYSNATALKAKILILSSTAIATGIGSAIWTAKVNASEMGRQEEMCKYWGPEVIHYECFVHFPWLCGQYQRMEWYYFSFVYEYCWNEFTSDLNIPNFDAIFHPESDQKSQMDNLQNLMSNYGLKLYHPQGLLKLRKRMLKAMSKGKMSIAVNFFQTLPIVDMINDVIFDGCNNDHSLRNDIMTAFILHIGHQIRNHTTFTKHPRTDSECLLQMRRTIIESEQPILKDLLKYHLGKGDNATYIELCDIWIGLQIAAKSELFGSRYFRDIIQEMHLLQDQKR
eukprot:372394_1